MAEAGGQSKDRIGARKTRDRAPRGRLRGGFAGVYERLIFYGVLGIFCVASLIWSLIADILYRVLPRRPGAAVGRFVICGGCRAGLGLMRITGLARFQIAGLDALSAEGPMVIACNHLSLLDAVLITSRLPDAVCICKAGLWDNRLLGGTVRLAGYIRNDAPIPMMRAACRALRDGRQLVIFPEGTRSNGNGLAPFKPGFAAMAKIARVPVQTVLLGSNTPYLRRGWSLHRMPAFPLAYRARVGLRIGVSGDVRTAAEGLERYFAAELTST